MMHTLPSKSRIPTGPVFSRENFKDPSASDNLQRPIHDKLGMRLFVFNLNLKARVSFSLNQHYGIIIALGKHVY